MKAEIAKEAGYTHLGKMYGIYCYVVREKETEELDIYGTNWLRRRGLDFFLWIEANLYSPTGVFTVEIVNEL